ncbi:MAG: LolA family protein [Chitinophagaceae bacterium]
MIRSIPILFLFVFCRLALPAQINTHYGQSDPRAKVILDGVSKKFKSFRTVTADFTLRVEDQDNKVMDSRKGIVYFKGNKYQIRLDNQEIICDGKTTWTYSKQTNEVQINNYRPDNNTISITKLFTNFYDKEFLYKLDRTTRENGRIVQIIEMTPLDKSKPFFKVLLHIDKIKKILVQAKIFNKDGHNNVILLSRFSPNLPISDQMFTFNLKAHPKVEVVDLR